MQQARIFTDVDRLFLDLENHKALGNKLLHHFFILRYAETHNCQPIVPVDSILDSVLEFKPGVKQLHSIESIKAIPCHYVEQTAYSGSTIQSVVEQSAKQLRDHISLLQRPAPQGDFYIKGHFAHASLMPSSKAFNTWVSLNQENLSYLISKYPSMVQENAVAVHLRDLDFATHLRHIFPEGIMLDDNYYRAAVREVEARLGPEAEYHIFSDNLPRLQNILVGKNVVVHNDSPNLDWTALFLMQKMIMSNSTFAWTASIFNKSLIIQPAGGHNYFHSELGEVPAGFRFPGAVIIDRFGERIAG